MRRYLVSVLAILSLAVSAVAVAGSYEDGRAAYDVGDFEKAMTTWAPAAESGDADSQYGMGLLYSEGIVVPMDDIQALHWFGWGVPMDEAEAMNWYLLAANNGVTAAQVSLGTMYQNGFSVAQDKVEALKWFTIAVRLGDDDARVHQEYLAERMPPEQLSKADADTNAWFTDHRTMLAETR